VSSIYGLGDPEAYLSMMVCTCPAASASTSAQMLRRSAELQYKRNDMELQRGTYRVRGDVIDIYPAESDDEAVRVELFDDEIEASALFDPLTGEVLRKVPRYTVFPKTHYVTPRETIMLRSPSSRSRSSSRSAGQLRDNNKLVEASAWSSAPASTWR
jgi:excinuclease ABC subunit B